MIIKNSPVLGQIVKNSSTVLLCKSKNTNEALVDLCKSSSKKFKRICIVSVNKPFTSLIKTLHEKKIDYSNFHFIDCISATFMQQIPSKQCTYISSPKALTELAIAIGGFIEDTDLIIFDNISGLFIHNGELMTLRFLNSIISRLSRTRIRGVYLLVGETKQELVADISLLVDKVVEI